jgi:hypothetical protein
MIKKIALTSSGPLSGKTTLSKYLEKEYRFFRVDHSLTIAQDLVSHENRYNHASLTVEDIYADKECWRPQLQEHSLRMGFSSPGRALEWTDVTLEPWYRSGSRSDIVFEPFRGEVQAEVMRRLGFLIVQLEISEGERARRAKALGKDYRAIQRAMWDHEELELGIANPDLHMDASLPVSSIAETVVRLADVKSVL